MTTTAPASVEQTSTTSSTLGRTGKIAAGVALSISSGVLATLSLPPYSLEWLILFAFVPMLVAQHRIMPRRLSGLAMGIGIGTYWAGFVSPGVKGSGADNAAMLSVAYPIVVGLVVTALAARSRSFHEKTSYRWFLVSAPAGWLAIEFLRAATNDIFAGTVGFPPYAMFEHPSLIQPVSVFGVWGLYLLILGINFALARLVIHALDRRRPALRGPAVVATVTVAWVVLSLFLLDTPTGRTVRVAAVQPAAERIVPASRRPDDPDAEERRRDFAMTRRAADQGAELVVWREGGIEGAPSDARNADILELARETGVYIVVGWGAEGRNDASLITPKGTVLGSYGKNHPAEIIGERSDNQDSFPPFETPFGRIGTVICYDLDFTDVAREWARRGAGLLAAPSADFPGNFATWHYADLVFRSIENRFSAVKADVAFDSAVIDPYGRIIEKFVRADGEQHLLVADVHLGSARSPQIVLGDWVAQIALAASIAFLVAGRIVRRRKDAEMADA